MFSDRLTPLFVYEIRRIVRNRAILTALCLYLLGQGALLAWTFYEGHEAGVTIGRDAGFGAELTGKILLLMFFAVNVLLFFSSIARAFRESGDELTGLAPLTWRQTALGQFGADALIAALFYAVTLPFLTVAWMLRGVDLVVLLLVPAAFFTATLLLNLFVTAAFARCKDNVSLLAGFSGLLLASPPLIGFGLCLPVVFCLTLLEEDVFFGPGNLVAVAVIYLVTVLFVFSFIMNVFVVNWDAKRNDARLFLTALGGWLLIACAGIPAVLITIFSALGWFF